MSKKCYLKKYEISKKTNEISKKMKSQKKNENKKFSEHNQCQCQTMSGSS